MQKFLRINDDFLNRTIIFASQSQLIMDQHQEIEIEKSKDFKASWVDSSVFLFYLQVFCLAAFVLGGCYSLYKHGYKGKPEVKVQSSTLYTPEYK